MVNNDIFQVWSVALEYLTSSTIDASLLAFTFAFTCHLIPYGEVLLVNPNYVHAETSFMPAGYYVAMVAWGQEINKIKCSHRYIYIYRDYILSADYFKPTGTNCNQLDGPGLVSHPDPMGIFIDMGYSNQ